MKKIVRTICISALSGVAFLAACCTSKGGLTKAERKQLIIERDSLQDILSRREGACIYGSPEIMANYSAETYLLRSKLDTINARLGENVDLELNARRAILQRRIADLQATIRGRESACIYGSPEVMEQYGEETRRLKAELEDLRNQLQELNK